MIHWKKILITAICWLYSAYEKSNVLKEFHLQLQYNEASILSEKYWLITPNMYML